MKKWFLILLALALIAGDIALTVLDPVSTSLLFKKNDLEKILLSNGTSTFDKAFYGNSVVISAFIEEESQSGYKNIAIDYGTIEDLCAMLEQDLITIEQELVVGLNYFSFLDTLDTNPTYPWHRRFYQPYLYFNRDRILPFLTNGIDNLLNGDPFVKETYWYLKRFLYYGRMSDGELAEKVQSHQELYWNLEADSFQKNIDAIDTLAALCRDRGIRLRAMWMPWNPLVETPHLVLGVRALATAALERLDIEVYDFTDALAPEYMHDIGHVEYVEGAPYFTRRLDPWLMEESK